MKAHIRGTFAGGPRLLWSRIRGYDAGFVARHPIRFARNLVGNHRSALAWRHLAGLKGIEIGGSANNDFFLDTINVDRFPTPSTAAAQRMHTGRLRRVDVIARADALPMESGAVDFVLASHVLEHVPDAIGALLEWARVARRYVFIILPRRDNRFDRETPLTTIAELEGRRLSPPPDEDRHHSVWTSKSFVALCSHLGFGIVAVQDPDDKRGNGFAVLLDVSGQILVDGGAKAGP